MGQESNILQFIKYMTKNDEKDHQERFEEEDRPKKKDMDKRARKIQGLGRALDNRANGASLSKLTGSLHDLVKGFRRMRVLKNGE